jgi:hypothetical protein
VGELPLAATNPIIMTTESTSLATEEDGSASSAFEAGQSQELEQSLDSASNDAAPSQTRQSKDTAANNRAAIAVACIVSISH